MIQPYPYKNMTENSLFAWSQKVNNQIAYIYNYIQMRGGNRNNSNQNRPYNSKPKSTSNNHITFILSGKDKVGISSSFNAMTPSLKTMIKTKCYGYWNHQYKIWQIPMGQYKKCLAQTKQLFKSESNQNNSNSFYSNTQLQPTINKIPEFVFNADVEMPLELEIKNVSYSVYKMIKYSQLETSIEPRVLPFYDRLYNFQKESLDFGIKKHGRLLLGDQMGVGKTIQSIAIASVYRHQWPFLVICPSSLRLNWQQEILTWLDQLIKKSQVQVYSKGGTPIRQNVKALIISYDLAWKIKEMLEPFKVVIADQAHYLKNSASKRSDALIPFLSTRKRVLLLSGTPALAKPKQLYNLLSVVRPDIFTNFKQFGTRYCQPSFNPWSRALEYNGCQNTKQLYYLIHNKIMIRRLKKEVLTQLPDKQRQKILVQTDKTVIKQIKELLNGCGGGSGKSMDSIVMDMLHQFDSNQPEGEDIRNAITMAYSLTSKAKLQSVKEYVLELLNNDIKLLVFGHHMTMLDGLQDMFEAKNIKYMRIDGSVSKEKRHTNVLSFQQDDNIRVALLSITAAGVGLTLTAASTVVFAELHWTPGMMVQAEDRAHRIGQKSSVNCHYLLGEQSLDDILYRNLEKKVSNVSSFIDGKETTLKIEKMSKGEKGKISDGQFQKEKGASRSLLTKFQSIKPITDKYFQGSELSQDSDISQTATDFNHPPQSEVQKSQKNSVASRRKMVEIVEQPTILETQTYKKTSEESEYQDEKMLTNCVSYESSIEQQFNMQNRSSQLCDFIMTNAQELLQYSQEQLEETQTQKPRQKQQLE